MRSVDEHRRLVGSLITARPPEALPLADALGLVLAEEVVAPLSLPGFDNSAMDGFAVRFEDVAGALPVRLDVVADVPHVFQAFSAILTEGDAALERVARFVADQLNHD